MGWEVIGGAVAIVLGLAAIGAVFAVMIRFGGERERRKQQQHDAELMRRIAESAHEPQPESEESIRDLLDRN